jgi:hypothetical protein
LARMEVFHNFSKNSLQTAGLDWWLGLCIVQMIYMIPCTLWKTLINMQYNFFSNYSWEPYGPRMCHWSTYQKPTKGLETPALSTLIQLQNIWVFVYISIYKGLAHKFEK